MDYRYENKGLHAHVHVPYRGKINISFDANQYILGKLSLDNWLPIFPASCLYDEHNTPLYTNCQGFWVTSNYVHI